MAPITKKRVIDPKHPWPGLESYGEQDKDYFYGRSRECQDLANRVEKHILTILFSPSGLGKTSLLKAGLFPELRRRGLLPIYLRLDHSDDSPTLVQQVWSVIHEHLVLESPYDNPESQDGVTLWEWFHDTKAGLLSPSKRGETPVLVFDQFEELFTIGMAGKKAGSGGGRIIHFLMECADLAENRAPKSALDRVESGKVDRDRYDFERANYRILIALREDYLSQLERLRDRMPALMDSRMPLDALAGDRAMEAVTGPSGDLVSVEVAERIVRFVGREETLPLKDVEVAPSLLSLVCRELNRRRVEAGLENISPELIDGNREAILERYYEECFEGLPPQARRWVENQLLTSAGHRDSQALETGQRRAGKDSVQQLIDARLIHVDFRGHIPRLELTHDVLASVVDNSRMRRYEREARLLAEKERKEATQREARVRKERLQARIVAGVMAVLALLSVSMLAMVIVKWEDAKEAEKQATNQRKDAEKTKLTAVEFFRLMSGDDLIGALGDVGRLEELNEVYTRAMDQLGNGDPQLKYGLLESRGRILHAHGRHREASEDIETARKVADSLETRSAAEKTLRDRYRARAQYYLAVVLRDQNKLKDAEKHFRAAIELQKAINGQPVAQVDSRSELADTYDELGYMLVTNTNRYDEARKALEQSLELRTRLLDLPEPRPAWEAKRARTKTYLGSCLARQNNLEMAINFYRDGLMEFEDLARRDQRHGQWKLAHETAILEYGDWLREAKKFAETDEHFRDVINTFKKMTVNNPHDPCLMNTVAVGSLGLADLLSRRNEVSQAKESLDEAIAIYRLAVEKNPSSTEARRGAVEAHKALALHFSRHGDYPAAVIEYEVAIDHMKKRIGIDSANQILKNKLANLYDNKAYAYRYQEDGLAKAEIEYRKGFEIRQKLVEQDPTNAEWQLDLSRSYNYLGDLARLGSGTDYEQALFHYQNAKSIREKQFEVAQTDNVWKARTAYSYGQMGRVYKDLKDYKKSIDWHNKAWVLRLQLVEGDPNNITWASDLATSHIELGEVEQLESRHPDALDNYRAAQGICLALLGREPGNLNYQARVAECQFRTGTVPTLGKGERLENLGKAIDTMQMLGTKVSAERRVWVEDAKAAYEELN